MWDRIRRGRFQPRRTISGEGARAGRRPGRQPRVEPLEARQLLTASLQPIANQTVPTLQGLTLPLEAASTFNSPQNFSVTSSNPDIAASVATGPFWTLNVNYVDPSNPSNNFSGPLTFQLLQKQAPNTVGMIQQFTNDGYYNNTGKWITRVATGFPGATNYVVQGGAPNSNGTGNSGQPGTPFPNENNQQIPFTGANQLAMANAGGTNSNDTQFFITTGAPNSELGYNYSIFGQMVSGQSTLGQLTQIPTVPNSNLGGEKSLPVNSPTFTASLSSTNPNGVLVLDATQATAGETSTITVTATNPADGTTTSQSFTVTVGAYTGPTTQNLIQTINFRPFANPTSATTALNTATSVALAGQGTFPVSGADQDLSYALASQPAHGKVTNFNAATGALTYTPDAGFTGTDTFQYTVTSSGPNASAAPAVSNPGTVTIDVSAAPPVATGAVRVIDEVMLITPLPVRGHKKNTIRVTEAPGTSTSSAPVVQVYVNGQLDATQPAASSLDNIIVFGSKAGDAITIDPSVTVSAVLDGGHGGRNRLKAGSSFTVMHGWFGHTIMVGGSGPNQMIGRAGQVKFRPSHATFLMFAGVPKKRTAMLNPTPPGGTFYVFKNGRIVPVPLSNVYPHHEGKAPIHHQPVHLPTAPRPVPKPAPHKGK